MFLSSLLDKMKRKVIFNTPSTAPVKYQALNQNVPADECPAEGYKPARKGGILCASSKKRFYFLMIMSAVVLLWIGIYYKLLNHRFQLPEPFRELRRMFGDGPSKNRRRFRETETENIDIEPQEHLPFVLNIAVIACKHRTEEALTVLKSATLFTKSQLHFHIFTDKKNFEQKTFDKVLNTWPAYKQHWMMYYTYPAIYPHPVQDKEKADWEKMFKPCASLRLFIARLLKDTDSVIYIDTDVVFLKPPEDLWEHFEKFDRSQIAGLAQECDLNQEKCWYPDHARHPFVYPYGVNSGVMLMNLTRMRQKHWENELIEIHTNNKKNLRFGDQDILNIYFNKYRKWLYTIPCEWNYRPDFCMKGNFCNRAFKHGVGALHGNRLAFQNRKVQPEFKAIYDAFRDFDFEKDEVEGQIVNATKIIFQRKYSDTSCGIRLNSILKFNTKK